MNQSPSRYVRTNDLQECPLIVIDKNNKIIFYTECQIVVSEITKDLRFKPEPESKLIAASFERCFIAQGRIVYINEYEADPCKYVLIYPCKSDCKNIKEIIEENNTNADAGISKESNDEIFKNQLLNIILEQCQQDTVLQDTLNFVLHDIKNYYELQKKPSIKAEEADESHLEISIDFSSDEETVHDETEMNQQTSSDCNKENENIEPRRSLRKRARKDNGFYNENKNVEENQVETSLIISPPSKKRKTAHTPSAAVTTKQRIYKPNYQVIKRRTWNGIVEHLVIFDSTDNALCYELTWVKTIKKYVCTRCIKHKVHVNAKCIKDQNDEVEYVLLSEKEHQCGLRKYVPEIATDTDITPKPRTPRQKTERSTIIKLPYYQLIDGEHGSRDVKYLYVFDADDRSLCYKYTWKNSKRKYFCNKCHWKDMSAVSAKIVKDKNGAECVQLGPKEHSCEILTLQSQEINKLEKRLNSISNTKSNQDAAESVSHDYKLVIQQFSGRDVQHLHVFPSNDKTSYYNLTWNQSKNEFICNQCMNRHHISVWARLIKNENGEETLSLSRQEHKLKK